MLHTCIHVYIYYVTYMYICTRRQRRLAACGQCTSEALQVVAEDMSRVSVFLGIII